MIIMIINADKPFDGGFVKRRKWSIYEDEISILKYSIWPPFEYLFLEIFSTRSHSMKTQKSWFPFHFLELKMKNKQITKLETELFAG